MSAGTGYNFVSLTLARAAQVNENFQWFRGHYLPITQSGTWANTTSVMDLGSVAFKWRKLYCGSAPSLFITDLTCTTAKVTNAGITNLTCTTANITNLTCTTANINALTSTIITVVALTATARITITGAPPNPPDINTLYKDNIPKAWLIYDQVAVTISASFNISSVTDVATGLFSPNWNRNFATTTYCVVLFTGQTDTQNTVTSVGSTQFRTQNEAGTSVDDDLNNVIAMGPQ